MFAFFAEVDDFLGEHEGNSDLAEFMAPLAKAKAEMQEGTTWLMQNGMADFNNAGAASSDFLHLFGLTAIAYMWARMAVVASQKKAEGSSDSYYDDKLVVARYYMERVLPDTAGHLVKLKTGAATMMALAADRF